MSGFFRAEINFGIARAAQEPLRADSGLRAALRCAFGGLLRCVALGVWGGGRAQESGQQANASFNNGAEIAVTVHDASREPITSTVMVAISKGRDDASAGRRELRTEPPDLW